MVEVSEEAKEHSHRTSAGYLKFSSQGFFSYLNIKQFSTLAQANAPMKVYISGKIRQSQIIKEQ